MSKICVEKAKLTYWGYAYTSGFLYRVYINKGKAMVHSMKPKIFFMEPLQATTEIWMWALHYNSSWYMAQRVEGDAMSSEFQEHDPEHF